MKKIIVMILAIIMFANPTTIKAQTAKKTVTATANIVAAISLESDRGLNFGTMSAPTTDVDVTLSTAQIVTASDATKISLFPSSATTARYNVTGTKDYAYTITLPTDNSVSISNGTSSIKLTDFQALTLSSGSNGTGGTLNSSGQDSFVVGATLKVLTALPTGAYSGSYDVLVTYN